MFLGKGDSEVLFEVLGKWYGYLIFMKYSERWYLLIVYRLILKISEEFISKE